MSKQYSIFDDCFVDSFAGGGGASTGIEMATGHPVDIAINHNEAEGMNVPEQINIFGISDEDRPCESCYKCEHFAESKEPRTYTNRDGEFCVFGMCFKAFCKNGSYSAYPVYIPEGKCKDFKKVGRKR